MWRGKCGRFTWIGIYTSEINTANFSRGLLEEGRDLVIVTEEGSQEFLDISGPLLKQDQSSAVTVIDVPQDAASVSSLLEPR